MRKMKDSGVEWIGNIPEEWSIVQARRIFKNEKRIVGKFVNNYERLALTLNGVIKRSKEDSEGLQPEKFEGYQILKSNELVFKMIDLENVSTSRVGLSPYIGIVSPAYIVFKSDLVDNRFYYYWFMFMYYFEIFNHLGGDGVRSALNVKDMLALPVVDIPIGVQIHLANYLDDRCNKINKIIEKQQAIIDKLREYKIAIITESVTKGLKTDVDMKQSNISWMEYMPSHWCEYRVANLYSQTSEVGLEDLPILTVSINSGISDRELADDEKDRVFVRSEDRTKYKRVRPGDLAYNMMRAWQGAFGAVRVDGMVSPAYVTCRPKPGVEIDTRYIEYLFRTPIAIEEMHRYSHGIADFRLRLYWPEFKNIRLCLPPIEEQREIADYIDDKTAKIEATIKRREDTIAKLQEYKKSLIYEVVTGKKEVL